MNPERYLREVLTVIADYPVNRVAELLQWQLKAAQDVPSDETAEH